MNSASRESGDPLRIQYVCGGRNFFSAAPGRKIFEVVRCWRKLGFEVDHICGGDVPESTTPRAADSSARPADPAGVRQRLAPLVHTLSELRDMKHDRQMLEHLRERSRRIPPDLVWERSARLHRAGLLHARELEVPSVLEWKDHLVNYRLSAFRNRALRMEDAKNRMADWLVVESGVLREQLAATGVEAKKIIVAHNAIDPDEFRPDHSLRDARRKLLNVPESCVLVGYLGSYAFYHDAPLLVQAAGLLRDRDIRFVMVGDGAGREACRELAAKSGVLDHTLFMMPRIPMEEAPALLAALDIAVLPGSTDIICPIKIQEYMASQVATVAPDYACNREVIADSRYGLLFPPGDAAALAEVIAELASNEGQRKQIAEAGRQLMIDRFTWDATWGQAMLQVTGRGNS